MSGEAPEGYHNIQVPDGAVVTIYVPDYDPEAKALMVCRSALADLGADVAARVARYLSDAYPTRHPLVAAYEAFEGPAA